MSKECLLQIIVKHFILRFIVLTGTKIDFNGEFIERRCDVNFTALVSEGFDNLSTRPWNETFKITNSK